MEWRRRADQQHKRQLWGKVSDEAPGEENTQENATESRGLGTPEEDSKSIRRDKLYQKKFCLRFKKIWGGGGELSEFSESRKISRNQLQEIIWRGFPGGSVVKKKKTMPNAEDTPSVPGPGRSHTLWSNWAYTRQLLKPVEPAPKQEKLLHWEACTRQGRVTLTLST